MCRRSRTCMEPSSTPPVLLSIFGECSYTRFRSRSCRCYLPSAEDVPSSCRRAYPGGTARDHALPLTAGGSAHSGGPGSRYTGRRVHSSESKEAVDPVHRYRQSFATVTTHARLLFHALAPGSKRQDTPNAGSMVPEQAHRPAKKGRTDNASICPRGHASGIRRRHLGTSVVLPPSRAKASPTLLLKLLVSVACACPPRTARSPWAGLWQPPYRRS